MPYPANPPTSGNPQTQGLIRRSKYLEDAIKGLQSTPQSQFDTPTGTWGNILSKAILGYAGNEAATKAEAAQKSDSDRLTAAILGTPQQAAADGIKQDAPFDLTPKGFDTRAQDVEGNRLKAISEMGGPMAALQYQQGQDALKYERGRDARGDFVQDRAFGFQQGRADREDFNTDRTYGFQVGEANRADDWRAKGFDQSTDQFNQTMGLQKGQLAETVRHNGVVEGLSARELDAKAKAAEAAASGDAVFDGPQLATIYNKSMGALEDAKSRQEDLDIIDAVSQQFLDLTKNDTWLQGGGLVNDLMQAGSMTTSQAKSLTDKIAPLIRKPGSGGNSDNDVKMFKSSVVNINNTPEGNQRAAAQAAALAGRGREYINYLTQAIDPREPQSKQKADALWNLYKADQPLFDPKSGAVTQAQPFQEWLSEHMGAVAGPAGPVAPAAAPPSDVQSLLDKYK